MNKIYICYGLMFFSNACFATSSMSGISKKGYFDDDNYMDVIQCENSQNISYSCQIKTLNITKIINVKNNRNCSYFSISDNPDIKGEVIISCGIYGENNTYYYDYNKKEHDWILIKRIYEEIPMDPYDEGVFKEYYSFSRDWRLNDEFKLINSDDMNVMSLDDIERKTKNKSSGTFINNEYLENIFMQNELNISNVTKYNNIAYYLEKTINILSHYSFLKKL